MFFPAILFAQEKIGINFRQDLSWVELLTKAKAEGKYIFIDAYTTWCGPCKMMENDVYKKKEVGDAINPQFITVKVQMDKTERDIDIVKKWYIDADMLRERFQIVAFPSFLFFSPDGQLVYKDLGYRNSEKFIKLAMFAVDPSRKNFRTQLAAYQKGERNFSIMPELSITTKALLGDKDLAFTIAKDYKENFLDKLNKDDFLKKENIQFINDNGSIALIHSTDYLFKSCYSQPQLIDSIIGDKGFSTSIVNGVIAKEEILQKLFKNDSAVALNPNWKLIKSEIMMKYPNVDAENLVFNEKIDFYRHIENWDCYTLYKSKQIRMSPPKSDGNEVFFGLNGPAWDVFLHCDNRKSLKRALLWIELALKLDKQNHRYQYIDTKANILYKLGNVNEAITCEKQAIDALEMNALKENRPRDVGGISNYQSIIKKMKAGLPTWPIKAGK